MPYIITNSGGDSIVIPDEGLNQDYSIDLVGRNYPNYGSVIATSQIRHLENFASTSAPSRATDGQLWYDQGTKKIRVYDYSSGAWLPLGIQVSATSLPNTNGQNKAGTAYFDTTENLLYIHDGSTFRESGIPGGSLSTTSSHAGVTLGGTPSLYGSKVRHIFLTDTAGVKRSVLAVVYTNNLLHSGVDYYSYEKIIAIFSGHSDIFTAADSSTSEVGDSSTMNFYDQLVDSGNGIGTEIKPGLNVRKDDASTVKFAGISERANAAYSLNTGQYEADGANITASNVYHKNAHIISNANDTYTVGASGTIFSEGYFGDIIVGNGTTGVIVKESNSNVTIGTTTLPMNQIHVEDLFVTGDITTSGGGSLGNVDNRIETIYANVINANVLTIDGYTMPTSAGNPGDIFVLGSTGNVAFKSAPQRVGNITSTNNSVDISPVQAIETDAVNGIVLTTTDYDYAVNVAYTRGLLSSANTSNISYDPVTGEINLTKTTPFDTWNPGDFVQIQNTQIVAGQKTFSQRVGLTNGANISGGFKFAGSGGYADDEVVRFTGTDGNYAEIRADATIFTVNDIIAFSDVRVKENLQVIPDALEKVKSLTGYIYDRIDLNKKQTGLIAQDVQKVLPEAVSEDTNGMLGVAYGNLIGLLVESIKKLSEEVDSLKEQLKEK